MTWRWVVGCLLAVIIVYGVILLEQSDWKVSVLRELVRGQWHILVLAILVPLGIMYLFVYLAPRIRPEVGFVTLIIIGMLLLFSSPRGNILHEYVRQWLDGMWDLELLAAAITVLSFAFTLGGIIIASRAKK